MNKKINAEEVSKLSDKISQMQKVIQLQNHHLDFIPALKDIDDARFYYAMVYRSLDNIHMVNQDVMKDMEEVAVRLSEIADELEQ